MARSLMLSSEAADAAAALSRRPSTHGPRIFSAAYADVKLANAASWLRGTGTRARTSMLL